MPLKFEALVSVNRDCTCKVALEVVQGDRKLVIRAPKPLHNLVEANDWIHRVRAAFHGLPPELEFVEVRNASIAGVGDHDEGARS